MANISVQFTWRHIHLPNSVEKEHKHEAAEVVYYIRGEGISTIGGTDYPYEPGAVCYIPQGVLHSEYHKTETEVLFFAFHTVEDLFVTLHGNLFHDENNAFLDLCTRIETENLNKTLYSRHMIEFLIEELLILLARSEMAEMEKDVDLPKIIEEACGYIHLHAHMNLSVKEIAEHYNYSYDHFRHIFKTYCGTGLKEYIQNERKNKIIECLMYSDRSINEIANVCNFGDVQTMSKFFKHMTGLSPMEYRKKYKPIENKPHVIYTEK